MKEVLSTVTAFFVEFLSQSKIHFPWNLWGMCGTSCHHREHFFAESSGVWSGMTTGILRQDGYRNRRSRRKPMRRYGGRMPFLDHGWRFIGNRGKDGRKFGTTEQGGSLSCLRLRGRTRSSRQRSRTTCGVCLFGTADSLSARRGEGFICDGVLRSTGNSGACSLIEHSSQSPWSRRG